MPSWQPDWRDVRWNTIAAISLANTLAQAAATLEAVVGERHQAGATYFADWQGPRHTFAACAVAAACARLQALAAHYRDLAAQVQTQDRLAVEEQRRREGERRRWQDELSDEQRRARQ